MSALTHDHAGISILTPAKGATYAPRWMPEGTSISILTPAKGATHIISHLLPKHLISILTPAKGATSGMVAGNGGGSDFNPHAREGRDPEGVSEENPLLVISILTPAKGATLCNLHIVHRLFISILTPAKGATRPLRHLAGCR